MKGNLNRVELPNLMQELPETFNKVTSVRRGTPVEKNFFCTSIKGKTNKRLCTFILLLIHAINSKKKKMMGVVSHLYLAPCPLET